MIFKNSNQIINNGQTPEIKQLRTHVLDIFNASIEAVDPYKSVKSKFKENLIEIKEHRIDLSQFDNIFLIGFGKASVGMSQAVSDSIDITKGAVVTNELNSKVKNNSIQTYIGSHPIPDEKSINSTEKLIEIVKECTSKDLLIVLISGGGSALFAKPKIPLKDLQDVTDQLLKCGADITEINTIRKHLSAVKGGQLVKYTDTTVVSLIISDIIGDPIDFIASGPTYPDDTTYKDAENILKKYKIWKNVPISAKKIINNAIDETPKPNDPCFKSVKNFIIANNEIACKEAQKKAEELGYKSLILTTSLDGESREVGKYLVKKAANFNTDAKKTILISGGETTVSIKGDGRGGRNQEMVLSTVPEISNKNIVFSSFATDGIDGKSNDAGAIADKFSLKRAEKIGLNYEKYLKNNDSNTFFKALGDVLTTSTTGTNVMDIQLIIIY